MRKVGIVLVSLGILLCLTACGEKNISNLKIENIKKIKKNDFYEYSLNIPQIKGIENEDVDNFNNIMQENMRYVLEHLSVAKDDEGLQNIEINYEVINNDFNVVSIVINSKLYNRGNIHNIQTIESYNFSKRDDTLISIKQFFTEGAEKFFSQNIAKKIKEKSKIMNTSGNEVIFFDNAYEHIDLKTATMYFEGDNVVFVFPEYALAPHSSGLPVFKFSKKEIKKYLN